MAHLAKPVKKASEPGAGSWCPCGRSAGRTRVWGIPDVLVSLFTDLLPVLAILSHGCQLVAFNLPRSPVVLIRTSQ